MRKAMEFMGPTVDRWENLYWYDWPFGRSPRGTASDYMALWEDARSKPYPAIDEFEQETSFPIDKQWLDQLALQTQIVIKTSPMNYQHGRILYSTLRAYLKKHDGPVTIVETGTARGFSSLCMARALDDEQREGTIITLDVLPHDTSFYWNCISDLEGPRTRSALLKDYDTSKIIFLQGDSIRQLSKLGVDRVHMAFLDGQHTYNRVMQEADFVTSRQQRGDVIVLDDVTQSTFPGVYRAAHELGKTYRLQTVQSADDRGYAILER